MKHTLKRSKAACSLALAALLCCPIGVAAYGVEGNSQTQSQSEASDLIFAEPDWGKDANASSAQSSGSESSESQKANEPEGEPADDRVNPEEEQQEADAATCNARIAQCHEVLLRAEEEVVSLTEDLTSLTEAINAFAIAYNESWEPLQGQRKSEEGIDAASERAEQAYDRVVESQTGYIDSKVIELWRNAAEQSFGKLDANKARKQLSDATKEYESAQADLVKSKVSALALRMSNRGRLERLIVAANRATDAAFEVEASCVRLRELDMEASDAFQDLNSTRESVMEARDYMMQSWCSHDSVRTKAQTTCGYWYNLLDALANNQGALTFGTGLDFSLSKDAFVAKWGAAVNAFYDQQAQKSGVQVPLAGYGEAIARSAYENRIDPRLCAAISVEETNGGVNCASFNAWNWKTYADGGAVVTGAWDSWEEAIEAWSKDVPESKMGYARVVCLSAFGNIYSSDAQWASRVADNMKTITSLAG